MNAAAPWNRYHLDVCAFWKHHLAGEGHPCDCGLKEAIEAMAAPATPSPAWEPNADGRFKPFPQIDAVSEKAMYFGTHRQVFSVEDVQAIVDAARAADASQIEELIDENRARNQENQALLAQVAQLTQEKDQLKGCLTRMSLVSDDIGIYMAGTHNPDGTFTPRTEFGEGWNAAVMNYGSALMAELYEMQDAGLVPDLTEEGDSDGEHYGVLVAFLRRAKRAEAELAQLRQQLTEKEKA